MRRRIEMHKEREADAAVGQQSLLAILRRKRKALAGQSIVEFAVTMPLLFLVIFGIIDIARLMQAQVTVSNAARQGVRFAVTGQQERDSGTGQWISRTVSIKQHTVEGLNGLALTGTNDPTEYGFYKVEVNPDTGGIPNGPVEVHVYYNIQLLTPLVSVILPRVLVRGDEHAIDEDWGAVQTFDHANLPPLPTPLATWTPYPTRTPTVTPTNTATATPTRRLVVSTFYLYKRAGTGNSADIAIILVDDLGTQVSGATVTVSGSWSGSLPNTTTYGQGVYGICKVGSFNDPASNMVVTVSASKPDYQSTSRTASAQSGYLSQCGP